VGATGMVGGYAVRYALDEKSSAAEADCVYTAGHPECQNGNLAWND